MNDSTCHANEPGWAQAQRGSALSLLHSSCSPAAVCRAEQSREDATTSRSMEITTAVCVTIVDPTLGERILSQPAAATNLYAVFFYELSLVGPLPHVRRDAADS